MKHMTITICALSLIYAADAQSSPVQIEAAPSNVITWQTFDAPPLTIQEGPDINTGVIDGIRDLVQEKLSSYIHVNKPLPYKRFLAYAKNSRNICTPYLYKNSKREQYMAYSKPTVVFPKVHAIMRRETYEHLGRPTSISLDQLFGVFGLRLSTNKVRSYGDAIDAVLTKHENNNLIHRHPGSTTRIFQMVARERSDFVLDIPSRINYWTKSLDLKQKDFMTVPISESAPTMISYIACPNTPWGRGVIADINRVLQEHVSSKQYLTFLQRWSTRFHQLIIENLYETNLLKHYDKAKYRSRLSKVQSEN